MIHVAYIAQRIALAQRLRFELRAPVRVEFIIAEIIVQRIKFWVCCPYFLINWRQHFDSGHELKDVYVGLESGCGSYMRCIGDVLHASGILWLVVQLRSRRGTIR